MSLRLYLDSAREPRTPNRSAGEWADFFDGAMELEAKNWPPLLWWAMFSTGDIMEARIADTEDAGTDEHAELLSQWGEATYPYLVVDQRTALSRLHARRQGLTDRLGAQFSPLSSSTARASPGRSATTRRWRPWSPRRGPEAWTW
ncbi:hypothetical protein [Streptomyces sp. NPDC057545]|uniref:hypothetical protein n=1 Tax=Streptomyces sp. NPDC057545 TaxID=3346164 RepID=UPI0036CA2B6A